eukprot:jgi/Mesvir1/2631/Mv01209-RA.1
MMREISSSVKSKSTIASSSTNVNRGDDDNEPSATGEQRDKGAGYPVPAHEAPPSSRLHRRSTTHWISLAPPEFANDENDTHFGLSTEGGGEDGQAKRSYGPTATASRVWHGARRNT